MGNMAYKYACYDGDILIGIGTGKYWAEYFGVNKTLIPKYATKGYTLHGIYTFKSADDSESMVVSDKYTIKVPEGWAEEWDTVTANVRELLSRRKEG